MRAPRWTSLCTAIALLAAMVSVGVFVAPTPARADTVSPFTPAFSTQDNGAIALIGNSQMTCPEAVAGCTAARAGTGTTSGLNNNNWSMAFIDADSDSTTTNSTSADLALPAGSTVLYALLVWGGRKTSPSAPITKVAFKPSGGAYSTLTGTTSESTIGVPPYQGFIDVTAQVLAAGNGTYWVANISASQGSDRYAGWSLAVAYRNPAAPLRDLEVFRGFAEVNTSAPNNTVNIPIGGFLTPAGGPVNASIGFVTWEGDKGSTGDAVKLNGTTLSAATNPATNFFNSSISDAGTPITTRSPNYPNNFGVDVTRVSANGVLPNGSRSTTVDLSTKDESYYPGIVTTQIDLFTPAFNPVSKAASNLSGNSPAQAGDTLEYQITLTNTGQDPADRSVITDPLPPGITFVPGSIEVTTNTGAATGKVTDTTGDDIGEYLAGSRTVRVRAGTGATASAGGTLGINATISFRFRATVDRAASGGTVTTTSSLAYRAQTIGKDYTFVGNAVGTPVATLADLQVSKTSTPTSQTAGTAVTYTLTAKNNGPTAASNAVITDTLPDSLTFASSAPPAGTSCSVSGQVVSCTTATLANGASVVVPIVATISPATAAGTVTNTVRVSSDTADDVGTNNTAGAATQVTTAADVSITKSASPTSASAGEQVTYTLAVANAGSSNATAVQVNDPIPAGQSVLSAISSTGSCTLPPGLPPTGTVGCALGTLGPGGQATITIVTRIGANVAAGPATNTATVSTTTPDPNAANNSASATVAIAAAADLAVSKTAATNPVVAGTGETFTMTVTNNGPSDAQQVVVADPAVPGLTVRSAGPTQGSCTVTGGEVSCAVGTIAAGGVVRVTIQADVAPDAAAGPLTNTASASASTPDPLPANNSGAATIIVSTSADLELTKSATPSTVVFGQVVTYSLTVRNNGPSQAVGASISDPLPAGLTFSTSPDGCTAAAGTVTCPVGTLAARAGRTVSFTAATPAGGSGDVTNIAVVSATTADPNTANNTASAVSTSQAQADLSLTKSASDSPVAGGPITYTLTARNAGPSTATAVVVTDTVPAGVTVTSATGGGITCTTAGAVVSCPVGTLASGQSAVLTIAGTLAPGVTGSSTNTASVSSPVLDPSPGNNTATATSTVGAQADVATILALASGQGATVTAGSTVNYRLTIRNNGPSTAVGVVATGRVPAGLTPVVGSSGGACVVLDGAVSCSIDRLLGGPLAPGAELTIPLSALVNASTLPGAIPATAVVGSTTPDPMPANNSNSVTIQVVAAADLAIAKSVSPDPLVAGGAAGYALTISNGGPSDARDVAITDTLPASVTGSNPTTSVGSCGIAGQLVSCTVPALPAGTSVTVTIPVAVSPTATGTVANTAAVFGGTPDPVPGNNTATISSPVQQQADLALVKTADPEPAVAGSAVTYTLLLGNIGPSVASAVTLTDALPDGLLVLPNGVSSNGGRCAANPAGSRVDCAFDALPVGAGRTVVVRALIPAGTPDGTSLTNTATLGSPTADPTPDDRTASAISTVTAAADLSVSKAPVNDPPEAGNRQGYVLSVTNAGPSISRGVVLADPLPPGTTFVSAETSTGSCSFASGTVSCAVGDVPSGQSPTVQLTVALDPGLGGSTLVNAATVLSAPAAGAPTADPDPTNNTSSVSQPVAARSDLTLVKQITSGPIVAGGQVGYRVTVSNGGPSDARNLVLADPVPAGTALVSATASDDGTCQPAAVVSCGWPLVPVGGSRTVTVLVTVPSGAVAGSIISNTATVRSDSFDNDPGTATATVSAPVTTAADLSAVKAVLSGSPVAGGQVRWQVVVGNAGPSDAAAVVLDDAPPAGVTFTASSTGTGTCTIGGAGLHCELGTLPAGGSVTVTVDGALAPDFAAATVTNAATVGSSTPDPDPTNNTGSVTSSTTTSADLAISKTATAALFTAGTPAGWTVTVTNAGPSTAAGGVVTDTLPAGLTDVTAAVVGGGDCTVQANPDGGSTVLCPLPPVPVSPAPPVQITVAATVAPGVVAPTVINAAAVTATTPDPDGTDNATSVSSPIGTSADVSLVKSGPAAVLAGEQISWTLRAANAGPSDAQAVVVTDTLPAGVNGVTAVGPRGPCSVVGGGVTCSLGVLSAGGTGEVVITGTVDPAFADGQLTNTAAVTSGTPDPLDANNSAAVGSDVSSGADVSVSKSFTAGDAAVPGRTVTWSVTAGNAGPSIARKVVITDAVPAGVNGVTAVVAADPDRSATCSVTGSVVSCRADAIAPGRPLRITISGTLDAGFAAATLDNVADVAADDDSTPDNNRSAAATPVQPSADLAIGKVLTSGRPVAGTDVAFELDIANLGPSDAAAVRIADQLPSEIDGASIVVATDTGSCGVDGDLLLACGLGTLAPGARVSVTVTGRLGQSLGSLLTNTATVASPTPDPAPGNNSSTAVGSIDESADLAVSKTGPASVVAGADVSWRVTVTNNGPSDARDVLLADLLPDGVADAVMTPDGGPPCAAVASCTLGTIPNRGSVSLTVTGTLASGFAEPSITNQVRVSSPSPDPDARNNETSVPAAVTTAADLQVVKSVTPDPLVPGRAATYTVLVDNAGPSDARATIATDPLPDGLTVRQPGVSASQGGCELLGRTVSCELGDVPGGGRATISIPVDVAAGYSAAALTNAASASSQTPDPLPDNNTGTTTTAVTGLADLTLTKTGPVTATAGDPLSWTLVLVNAGPSVAQDVVVSDPIPAGVVGASVSSTHGSCTITAGPVDCVIGALAPGDIARIQVFVAAAVDPGFTGDTIANTATVSSGTPEPDPQPEVPDGRSSTATTAVTASADLSVSKVPTAPDVAAGGRPGWTVTVTNNGPSTARGVSLTDSTTPALARPSYQTADGAALDCPGGVCVLGDIRPGPANAVPITVSGDLAADFTGDTVANTAAVASPTPDPTPGNNDATSTVPVFRSADLLLTKTADRSAENPAVPGEPISWQLTLLNRGPSTAGDVELADLLPGLTNVTATADGASCDEQVVCRIGDLAVGELSSVQITVTGTLPADYPDQSITNVARATSSTPDPTPGDQSATLRTPVAAAADLAITKTGPAAAVTAGSPIAWTVTVTNYGPSVARAVTLADPAPAGVTGLAAVPDTGSCTGGSCALGDLAVGATARITLTATVAPGFTGAAVRNVASATSDTPDPVGDNNSASTSTPVTAGAGLSIRKTISPDPAVPGAPLTFTLTVANAGPSTARSVTVLDSLPDGLTDPVAAASSGSCAITDGTALLCTTDALDPGAPLVVTVTATLAADVPAGTVSNTATVAAETDDPDLSDNGAGAGVPTIPADLTVTKSATVPQVAPRQAIGWTVTVTNNGPGTARTVAVQDTLPAGVTLGATELTGATGSCSGDPVVLCLLGDLPAGDTATLLITGTVNPSTQGTLTNTAAATSPDESAPADNVAQADTTVVAAADLAVAKTLTGPAPVAGGPVSWTLEVGNRGPAVALGVLLTDPLPAGLGAPVLPAGCVLTGGTVACAVGDLPVDGVASRVITATVDPAARDTLVNTVTATGPTLDPDPGNNTATASSPIGVSTALAVRKTADRSRPAVGESVVYTITVSNAGPSAALGVSVTEQLPTGGVVVAGSGSQGSYTSSTGIWTVGTVQPGLPAVMTLTVSYDRPGEAVNTVSVTSLDGSGALTASAPVTVLPAPVTPGEPGQPGQLGEPGQPGLPGSPDLPTTGFAAQRFALWGLGLLLGGLVLLRPARRRRTDPPPPS